MKKIIDSNSALYTNTNNSSLKQRATILLHKTMCMVFASKGAVSNILESEPEIVSPTFIVSENKEGENESIKEGDKENDTESKEEGNENTTNTQLLITFQRNGGLVLENPINNIEKGEAYRI